MRLTWRPRLTPSTQRSPNGDIWLFTGPSGRNPIDDQPLLERYQGPLTFNRELSIEEVRRAGYPPECRGWEYTR